MSDQIRVDGFQTFWNLPEHFNRETVAEGLAKLRWKQHCPLSRSNSSALREALQELVEQWKFESVLVRPLDDVDEDGYAVVHEETGNSENEYTTLFTARWRQPSENVEPYAEVVNGTHTVGQSDINSWFQHYRARITSHSIAKMIRVLIVEQLNGISLRPSGGFYWLPYSSREKYDQLIDLIYRSADDRSKCKIYVPGFNLTDPGAVEAVRDAIVNDITQRVEVIKEQASRNGVKGRALENRKRDAQALHSRIKDYEAFLGEVLPTLHNVADECEQQVVAAAISQFPDIFGIGKQAEEPLPTGALVDPSEVTAEDVNPFSIL